MSHISNSPEKLKTIHYILAEDGITPIPAPDVVKFYEWFDDINNRFVRRQTVHKHLISTIFIGIDHSFGRGDPELWETMVFPSNSVENVYCDRYSSYKDAIIGHKKAVAWVKENIKEDNADQLKDALK